MGSRQTGSQCHQRDCRDGIRHRDYTCHERNEPTNLPSLNWQNLPGYNPNAVHTCHTSYSNSAIRRNHQSQYGHTSAGQEHALGLLNLWTPQPESILISYPQPPPKVRRSSRIRKPLVTMNEPQSTILNQQHYQP